MEEHKGTCASCGGSDVNVNDESKCETCAVPTETNTETNTNQEQDNK